MKTIVTNEIFNSYVKKINAITYKFDNLMDSDPDNYEKYATEMLTDISDWIINNDITEEVFYRIFVNSTAYYLGDNTYEDMKNREYKL